MGLTFTLTSFTCTSPFVGTILVSAANGDWQMPLVGMLAFSTVFALPFFVLALAAAACFESAACRRLDEFDQGRDGISGSRGGDEISLERRSDLEMGNFYAQRRACRSGSPSAIILAIYLLGKFQLPHDSKPERSARFACCRQICQSGDQFLSSDRTVRRETRRTRIVSAARSGKFVRKIFGGKSGEELNWIKTICDTALAQAKAENKRVFIDFTGYTCTNCRWMEANVFDEKRGRSGNVRNLFWQGFITDGEGEIYERNSNIRKRIFKPSRCRFTPFSTPTAKPSRHFPV